MVMVVGIENLLFSIFEIADQSSAKIRILSGVIEAKFRYIFSVNMIHCRTRASFTQADLLFREVELKKKFVEGVEPVTLSLRMYNIYSSSELVSES
jgi:hypothetical protein